MAAPCAGIPVTERFVGYPTYNHPLLLVGRKMALGYPGHVEPRTRLGARGARVDALMNGVDDGATAAELRVRYLFWVARKRGFTRTLSNRGRSTPIVASGEWGVIYDLAGSRGL